MQPVTVEELLEVEDLKDVPASQLQWLIDNCRYQELTDGELLFKAGDPVKATNIILKGIIRIRSIQHNQSLQITDLDAGSITGYLPFSRIKNALGNGECVGNCRILSCPQDVIHQAISLHYALTEALVHTMTSRVREFTQIQQQNEKMMALGKLSAGLAHELNNPAAAITRNAFTLKKQLLDTAGLIKALAAIQLNTSQTEVIITKLIACNHQAGAAPLSLMERSNREEEITAWLMKHHTSSGETADALVEAGISLEDLEDLSKNIPDVHLPPVFNWLINHLVAGRMVNDIHESAKRISDLVSSVKSFTYMDQAPDKQCIDLHSGIRNTLTMLEYKLRKGNIVVKQSFAADLPKIEALPGALNQVWANIIDNAIDAMEVNKNGILDIRTAYNHQQIQVLVIDNGQGIPDNIKSRIFDPFFTTKELGRGTGLGLDLVMQVIRRHNGTVKVNSVPGNTEFMVCLPINNN